MRQIRSERDALARSEGFEVTWRPHRYVGGPPPPRIKRMQLAHECRARAHGVAWDTVDLRIVYRAADGKCGICGQPVGLDEFTIDHIIPLSQGGPHVQENLQPAHFSCNSHKGDRPWTK